MDYTKEINKFTRAFKNIVNGLNADVTTNKKLIQAQTEKFQDEIKRLEDQIGTPPPIEQPKFLGFGKNATGGNGGEVVRVKNRAEVLAAIATEQPKIISLVNDIDLSANQINFRYPNKTTKMNGFSFYNNMVTVDAKNQYFENGGFDGGNQTKDDALQLNAWGTSLVEDVYFKNCDIKNGNDESLSLRKSSGATLRKVTFDKCKITNNVGRYGTLQSGGVTDITYFMCYLNSPERNVRSKKTDSSLGLSFEMINCIIKDYQYATAIEFGNAFSVINCLYDSLNAKGYLVDSIHKENGIKENTRAYFTGCHSVQGATIESDLKPYLIDTPFKSSGITPINAKDIDINLIGIV